MVAYEKNIKEYGEFLKAVNVPALQPIEVESADVAGTPALKVTMSAPPPPAGAPPANYASMISTVFGPGGKLVGWIVPVNAHTVIMDYANKDLVQQTMEAIKQGKPGLAGDADLVKTAALLPPNASSLVYVSPQGTIEFVKRIVTAMGPPALTANLKVPEFPATPPLGLAVTTAANELDLCLVVPPEVLSEGSVFAMKLRQP